MGVTPKCGEGAIQSLTGFVVQYEQQFLSGGHEAQSGRWRIPGCRNSIQGLPSSSGGIISDHLYIDRIRYLFDLEIDAFPCHRSRERKGGCHSFDGPTLVIG